MSRYPVKYFSASKKGEVDIESMATPHICNAWRKLAGAEDTAVEVDGQQWPHSNAVVRAAFESELRSRGCTLDAETQQWTIPSGEEP